MRGGVFGPEKKGCCSSTNVTELLPGFQFAINHRPNLITLNRVRNIQVTKTVTLIIITQQVAMKLRWPVCPHYLSPLIPASVLIVGELVKKSPAFYGNRKPIAKFIRDLH